MEPVYTPEGLSVPNHENRIAEKHLAVLPKAAEERIVNEIYHLSTTLVLNTEHQ
ncbi:hypothetical protein D3C83_316720 [compost metagenome]